MLKFLKETEETAKSIDEAIDAGLKKLNATRDEVDIEVLEESTKGFLGLGSKGAKVRVFLKDSNAGLAKNFLDNIFRAMDLDVTIDAKSEEDGLKIDLSGDNMGIIIGKRGDTLDSLQYLTSLVVNHQNDDYVKLTLDTENYRAKRMDALLALAKRLASKVASSGRKYTLEPMNPYERRIIHSTLQNHEHVTTFSVGEDPYRKVVIAPKNPAPKKSHSNMDATSRKPRRASTEDVLNYLDAYSSYKKTAPRHDIKKAENFEAWEKSMEAGNLISTEEE